MADDREATGNLPQPEPRPPGIEIFTTAVKGTIHAESKKKKRRAEHRHRCAR